MGNIPTSLVSEFAKVMNDTSASSKTIIYGTITSADPPKVQIDGSDIQTPFTSTTIHSVGDRVKVEIDNHHVVVSGNFTDPSINQEAVDDTVAPVAADLEAAKTDISNLGTDVAALEATVSPMAGEIEALSTDVESLSTDVSAMQTDISTLETEVDAKVDSNGVISAINTSTEGVRILEGKVTHQDISGKANKSTLISEINSSAEGTKILAGKVVHQDISGKADIASLISEINASAEGIKIASSKLTSDSTKADKDNLISQINVSPEAIQISSNKINLQGAVTMSSLASDVTDELDDKMDILDYCKSTDTTKIDGGKIFVDQAFANSVFAKDVTATGNISFSNDRYGITANDITGEVDIESVDGDLHMKSVGGDLYLYSALGTVHLQGNHKVSFDSDMIEIMEDPMVATYGLVHNRVDQHMLYPYIHSNHIRFGKATITYAKNTVSQKVVTFDVPMASTPIVFIQDAFDSVNMTATNISVNGFTARCPGVGSSGTREFTWIAFAIPDSITDPS